MQKTGRKPFPHAGVEDEGAAGSTQGSKETEDERVRGEDVEGLRFTPIRTVEVGTFRFETWIEEWPAKFQALVQLQRFKDPSPING